MSIVTPNVPKDEEPFVTDDGRLTRSGRIFLSQLREIVSTFNTSGVTAAGDLTANHLVLGDGAQEVIALAATGGAHDLLHGNPAGPPNFGPIDLATEVGTSRLPYANLTAAAAASELLGRGSAGGAGDWEPVTLGPGLTMAGTVLDSTSSGLLLKTAAPLTDAQIKALPTTDVQIVASPGLGKRILPIGIDLKLTLAAGGDYTNIDVNGFAQVSLGTSPGLASFIVNDPAASTPLTDLTTLLTGAPTQRRAWMGAWQNTTDTAEQWGLLAAIRGSFEENLPLTFSINNAASGNLTGGNAGNSGTLTAYYLVG